MVRLTRIYTRTGDGGQTRLADMSVINKTDPRVEAYGDVDEANSAIGVALAAHDLPDKVAAVLRTIQNEMFDVGADLSKPLTVTDHDHPDLRVTQAYVDRLEDWCDEFSDHAAAAGVVHPARGFPRLRPAPCGAYGGPPGRAGGLGRSSALRHRAGHRARYPRRSQSPGHDVPEPAVRPALHPHARRERPRWGRAVGTRRRGHQAGSDTQPTRDEGATDERGHRKSQSAPGAAGNAVHRPVGRPALHGGVPAGWRVGVRRAGDRLLG